MGLRPPGSVLFWLNSISAVVDNATLTAAEIGPSLSVAQQRAMLMGLLISGGMLIPGNIPNIVAPGRLDIGSREWARVGLITGLPLVALCFAVVVDGLGRIGDGRPRCLLEGICLLCKQSRLAAIRVG